MRSYRPVVSIHRLFAILLVLSLLFAPSLTSAAMAASPDHNMQMMEAGHCDAPTHGSGHQDKMDGKSCCISTCTAVAIAPASPFLKYELQAAPAVFAVRLLHLAYLGEIATPPPRIA